MSGHQIQKKPYFYADHFSAFFFFFFNFFIFWQTPISISWWMPNNRQKFFLNLYFLCFSFFIPIVPLKKFIIILMITIIIIIVILPHIYPLPCNKPIRDKLQRRRVIPHRLITYFLCLKMISSRGFFSKTLIHISSFLKQSGKRKNNARLLRIASLHISCVLRWSGIYSRVSGLSSTGSFTHFLCCKVIGDSLQIVWILFNSPFTYPLGLEMIKYKSKGVMIFDSFSTHLLRPKAKRNMVQQSWICLNHLLTHLVHHKVVWDTHQ